MICPSCAGNTRVIETKATSDGAVIRRRRACDAAACGHRFSTYESTLDPSKARARKRRAQAAWLARVPEEERSAYWKKGRLRASARDEAVRTGQPVNEILSRWGVSSPALSGERRRG